MSPENLRKYPSTFDRDIGIAMSAQAGKTEIIPFSGMDHCDTPVSRFSE
jgi:hypothetical protein